MTEAIRRRARDGGDVSLFSHEDCRSGHPSGLGAGGVVAAPEEALCRRWEWPRNQLSGFPLIPVKALEFYTFSIPPGIRTWKAKVLSVTSTYSQ